VRRAAALALFASCALRSADPSPGISATKEQSRQLACTHLGQLEAHQRYPSEVPEPASRELATGLTEALVCSRRVLRVGERSARDELILSKLTRSTGELTELASASFPEQLTWHVDALYPNQKVASKIALAARLGLAERGRAVSDRVPVLAAGDIEVLIHLSMPDALKLACSRYFAEKSLGDDEVLLAFSILDSRESQLHAGTCRQGQWRWLQ
jgi:hypothetical protein